MTKIMWAGDPTVGLPGESYDFAAFQGVQQYHNHEPNASPFVPSGTSDHPVFLQHAEQYSNHPSNAIISDMLGTPTDPGRTATYQAADQSSENPPDMSLP